MLKDLIARFARADDAAPLPPDDARLALTALMVRAARADGQYDAVEHDAIRDVLSRRHGLDAAAADALLAEAEAAEAAAPDTVRFTRLIKQAVPYEDRADVMEALWTVALADGRRDPAEDAALRQIAPLIGVSDRDSALARQRAAL
ncbi:MAG: TerB family tellurite resistance protein [Pseudomonadota bacterium]